MTSTPLAASSRPHLVTALLATLGMIVVILTAHGFERIGGYIPCALCLLERRPYYLAIPVGLLAILSSALNAPPMVTRTLLAITGAIMLVGAGMGVYHAGVEWKFWDGPAGCSPSNALEQGSGSLLDDLSTQHAPSCTEATLRILGLSFAGWNVVASVILAAIAFRGALKRS